MKTMLLKCLSFVLLTVSCLSDATRPEVKTRYGTYRGQVIKSKGGRDIWSFKGIPYAQPPVGELRFKDPVKLKEREGVYNADRDIECIQPVVDFVAELNDANKKVIGVEDCLHLNIYVPKVHSDKLLPVYFWIHGGAYYLGSGSEAWNGPLRLLDEPRDMVVVSINYRLGVLGFLSTTDANLPGNYGLKDQTMALKWVQENIKAFGGDPNSVTIGGVSAGSGSVSHHLHSKASRGLFQRAIAQSGTADASWATSSTLKAKDISSKILSILGCSNEPKKLLPCLQKLPAEKIVESITDLKVPYTGLVVRLAPVVEQDSPNAFMTEESIEEGSAVPLLAGVTDEEGIMLFQFLVQQHPGYYDLSILEENYKELLPIIGHYTPHPRADEITQKLYDFYFKKNGFTAESTKNFVDLISDRMFNHGLHISAKKHKGDVYLYLFSYRGDLQLSIPRPKGFEYGVTHSEDVAYFFDSIFSSKIDLEKDDLKFSKDVMNMWYNFIKGGDPTPDTHIWEESDGGKKYLDLTNDGLIMASDMFKERMEFLDELDKALFLHDEL